MPYHTATFRLLGVEPRPASSAKMLLDDAAKRLGLVVPPSVQEWYECESAIQILADNSNDDPPIEVAKFALTHWNSKTLLPIRRENQGVCAWAIDLDGSDDPPVLVDVDTDGRQWHLLARTFSEYVYSCVWDYTLVLRQPALVQAQNPELTETAIASLAKLFRPELRTHGWPGNTQYRFGDNQAGILVWAADEQADWFVGAADAETLGLILAEVWQLDDVGDSLYSCTDLGQQALRAVRGRPARNTTEQS